MVGRPFREAPIRECCELCDAIAEQRCERCGAPLCAEHAPDRSSRCVDCEALYDARVNRPVVVLLPLGIWLASLALGGIALSTLFADSLHSGRATVWLLLASLFLTPFVVGTARSIYALATRWRFLHEHDQRSRSPVQYSAESWFEIGESWSRR